MKEPEYTCPKKEEIEELLRDFSDTEYINSEIDNIAEKLKSEYKSQYEWYVDKILIRLDNYRDSVEEVRHWGQHLKKENEKLKDLVRKLREFNISQTLEEEINELLR